MLFLRPISVFIVQGLEPTYVHTLECPIDCVHTVTTAVSLCPYKECTDLMPLDGVGYQWVWARARARAGARAGARACLDGVGYQ